MAQKIEQSNLRFDFWHSATTLSLEFGFKNSRLPNDVQTVQAALGSQLLILDETFIKLFEDDVFYDR